VAGRGAGVIVAASVLGVKEGGAKETLWEKGM
jgi:hypothetical protein